ncbi:galactitol-specific PTS transporter subunit IIC [Virgibacillus proomii]|uniref:galactitol-specific PTS transporter subunit IIC n=1 Tax=Virgibacillus proomii TaxID=84407 RepID=UPI001C11AF69|nr:PTS galactitol transporter subunit IIC [Virgibacillus proomii]MBU5266677.1 PTS galactitol transporter subunit IIC [Virgibacillus proomii]
MESFVDFIQSFLGLGATVILPVAIFILGVFFGQKVGKAFRSALTIGVAFVGIFLVIDLLTLNLGPAAQGMVNRLNVELNVIDVGWPATSSIAWASVVAAFIIPLGLIVNAIMLFTKTTKVMNVDVWNYWHYTFAAAVVYTISGSVIQGLIAAVLFQIVCLKVADWTTPMVRDFYEMPGVSVATGSTISYAPFIFLVKFIRKIPGLKNLHADPDSIQKRFGVFGDSMVVGLFLGIIIGLLAGYSIGEVIEIGMSMAAVMILMPRMVKILMEGLMPVSESARTWLNNRFGESDITIGLDAAVLLGHPSVIATALILTPVTVLIAVILPGNNVLPFGDLATIPFIVAFIVGAARGNIIHSIIVGTVMIALSLYMATDIAPVFTDMAMSAEIKLPEGSAKVSSIDQGGNLLNWLIWRFFELFN